MPFKTFLNWAFDGKMDTPIPKEPDILSYKSPIKETYLLSLFLKNGELNYYLNTYINNIGVRYIDKTELFLFVKRCIIDFKINRRSIPFVKYKRDKKLFSFLTEKYPMLKRDEIGMLCDYIDNSEEKNIIYEHFGLEKPKKYKSKKGKKSTKNKNPAVSVNNSQKEKLSQDELLKVFRIVSTGR